MSVIINTTIAGGFGGGGGGGGSPLANNLTTAIPGGFALDAAQGPVLTAALATKITDPGITTIGAGTTAITHATHANRLCVCSQSSAVSLTFSNNAGSGGLDGDYIFVLNEGSGVITMSGAITAPGGAALSCGLGQTVSAFYSATADAWYSTTGSSFSPITVSGTTAADTTNLTATVATGWNPTGNWTRDGTNISGATSLTYTKQIADYGHSITFATAYYIPTGISVVAGGVADTFNRADSSTLGTSSSGATWVAASGSNNLGISTNRLYNPTTGATTSVNLIESTLSSFSSFTVDFSDGASGAIAAGTGTIANRLIFRGIDNNNYMCATWFGNGFVSIDYVISGTPTNIASASAAFSSTGAPLTAKVSVVGTTVTMYVKVGAGSFTSVCSGTIPGGASSLASATLVGLFILNTLNTYMDNLAVVA